MRDVPGGGTMMPSLSVDISKIPPYPLMDSLDEYLPRDTMKRILFYTSDPSRPIPNDKIVRPEFIQTLKYMFKAIDPRTDLVTVAFKPRIANLGRWIARRDQTAERIYPGICVGSQLQIPTFLRATIWAKHNMIDLDQHKSHPTLLATIARLVGVHTPALTDYLTNTDAVQQRLAAYWTANPLSPVRTKDVKRLINRTVYGGGLTGWLEELRTGESTDVFEGVSTYNSDVRIELRNTDVPPEFYTALKEECRTIQDIVYNANPALLAALNPHPSLDENQKKRKLLAYFCGCLEHYISYTAMEVCVQMGNVLRTSNGRYQIIWGYDGFTFLPQNPRGFDVQLFLAELNTAVRAKLGTAFSLVEFRHKVVDESACFPTILADNDPLWESREFRLYDLTPSESENPFKMTRSEELQHWRRRPYSEWKENFERVHFKVEDPTRYGLASYNDRGSLVGVVWYDLGSLKHKYLNYMYLNEKKNKKTNQIEKEEENAVSRWVCDPEMRVFLKADAYPAPLVCPRDVFNTWTDSPWHNSVVENPEEDQQYVQIFMELLKIVCGGDRNSEEFMIYWNADWVQRPAVKSGIIPVIIGSEGTGKSIFCTIIGKLVGKMRYLETTISNVVDQFNSLLEDKLVVCLNELNGGLTTAQNAVFKQLLTDPEVTINRKGAPQYNIKSYHRFIGTSNFPGVVDSERRPFYVRSSCDLLIAENKPLVTKFAEFASNDKGIAAVYRYLQSINFRERWGAERIKPPDNQFNRMIRGNRNPFASFAWYLVEKFNPLPSAYPAGRIPEIINDRAYTAQEFNEIFTEWIAEQKIVLNLSGQTHALTQFLTISWPDGVISGEFYRNSKKYRNFNFVKMRNALNILHPQEVRADVRGPWEVTRVLEDGPVM
jgi:hypothetical protein